MCMRVYVCVCMLARALSASVAGVCFSLWRPLLVQPEPYTEGLLQVPHVLGLQGGVCSGTTVALRQRLMCVDPGAGVEPWEICPVVCCVPLAQAAEKELPHPTAQPHTQVSPRPESWWSFLPTMAFPVPSTWRGGHHTHSVSLHEKVTCMFSGSL